MERLFERVVGEQGRLDLLVNAVACVACNEPFLETALAAGLACILDGGLSHVIATHAAARRMVGAGSGLIVNVSDHEWDPFYAMEKALTNRIALSVAEELRGHGVAILSLLPGALFKCFDIFDTEALRLTAERDPTALRCHTPRLIGRGVVALANDPEVMAKTGRLIELKEIVGEYGLADIDGRDSFEMW